MDAYTLRLWLCLLFISATRALGEQMPADSVKPVVTLPEVTIFAASGSPAQHFTFEQIQKSNATTAAEFLESVPGISVRRDGVSGGYSTVKIGGSNANQVLVFVDGVVWNDVGSGEASLSSIPTQWIQSLNVYRGASTTLSGEAIGGIIEIHTSRESKKSLSASLSASETDREISISRGASTSSMDWFAAYCRLQGEGDYRFRITEEDGNGPFTEHLGETFMRENNFITRDQLTANLGAKLSPHGSIRVNGWLSRSSYGMPGYLAPRPTPQASADESRRIVSLNFTQSMAFAQLEVHADRSERRYSFTDPDPLSWIHSSDESTQRSAVGITATESLNYNTLVQTVGLQRETIGSEAISGGEAERWKWNAGILGSRVMSSETKSGFDLNASAGLRGEGFGDFEPVLLPEASLTCERDAGVRRSFTVSASRAYRAPSFYDLFWDDELLSSGNPQLRPETSSLLRAEASIGFGDAFPTSLRVSAQDNQVKDLIYWHPAFDGHWTPDNLRKASLQSLQIELNREWIPSHLESSLSHEWLEARDRSGNHLTDGEYLIYRSPQTSHIALHGEINSWKLRADYVWSDRQYVLETNSKWLSDYSLVDAGVSRAFSLHNFSVNFTADVSNLFNKDFRIVRHAPMPLRQYRLSLSITSL